MNRPTHPFSQDSHGHDPRGREADRAAAVRLAARGEEVAAALAKVLPPAAILKGRERTRPYECDGLTAFRVQPMIVVLPENEAQLAAALCTCHRLGVPVVARGAGTGLSGGALPHRAGVTVSLAKFNKILRVDPLSCTAVVQCGVRNLAISEAAAPFGLYYAPDPSSQIACTIGGNVAENSGGVHCLKYGLTLHNVLRVRGLTAAGEPVEFGSEALDAPGLDLLAIVIGSEGMLAVTTEVTVKLVPRPELARCMLASFATVEAAGDAVANVIARGIIPAGLELMDRRMTAVAENFVHAGYDLSAAAILLCESDGAPEEVEEEIAAMRRVLTESGATRIEVSRDEAQRLQVLERPQECVSRPREASVRTTCAWTPPSRAASSRRCCSRSKAWRSKYGLRCVNVFHAGDGNLHPLDPVRCKRSRSIQALRAVRRGDPRGELEARRHRHRRARGRRGEAQLHVRAVLARGARPLSRRQARFRPRRSCSIRAR